MREADIMREIMLALSECGCTIWRNNCGSYTDQRSGSFVRYGIANPGGSDLIGISADGRFVAIEVKTQRGRATQDQVRFINLINARGGIAGVCRSAAEALELIRRG